MRYALIGIRNNFSLLICANQLPQSIPWVRNMELVLHLLGVDSILCHFYHQETHENGPPTQKVMLLLVFEVSRYVVNILSFI